MRPKGVYFVFIVAMLVFSMAAGIAFAENAEEEPPSLEDLFSLSVQSQSVPAARYDLGWEGPYFFTAIDGTGFNMYNNYSLYGIPSAAYKLSVVNNGSAPAAVFIVRISPKSGIGGISVPPGKTLTMTFAVPSSATQFFLQAYSDAPLNISGCVYY
jgi:hypothetical protein